TLSGQRRPFSGGPRPGNRLALPARPPRRGDHLGGPRRAAEPGLRTGRQPLARAEGTVGPAVGLTASPEHPAPSLPRSTVPYRARCAAAPPGALGLREPAAPGGGEDGSMRADGAGDEPVPGYKLVRMVGQGRCGWVWRAEGPGGSAVALKYLPLDTPKA